MAENVYKPDIYDGNDPYIYVSYHQDDRNEVMKILEKMDLRGFRFWIDEGIAPGMETDETIAEHIEKSDFFIAFLSNKYLGFLDKVDELNFSRDVDKEYLLIYLEDAVLPAGLDMRFMRAQSLNAYSMEEDDILQDILNINGARRFYGVADPSLQDSAERVFGRLEKLYPEHKVFALDAVGKQVSKEISGLYVKAGYPNVERLLLDYGFTIISTDEARRLRSSVLYQPGAEPDIVKTRIDNIMNSLLSDYPERVITDTLSKTHKSINSSLQGLSVWLGYESVAEMLTAYGFSGVTSESGRIAVDYNLIISQLQQRYEGKTKPKGVSELIIDNPDLKGNLKTLANRAVEYFGMTLNQYLRSIGLVVPIEKEEKSTVIAQRREEILAQLRVFYDSEAKSYGTYEEAEEIISQLVLKINAKGEKYIYDSGACEEALKIPYGINFIAKEAFLGQTGIVSVCFPSTLENIKDGAFSDCAGIKEIIFSEGLEIIGNGAFSNCISLKKIVLPKSLKRIGNEAFSGCEGLEEVEFGNIRTNVQDDAFDGCIFDIESLQETNTSPSEYFELKVDKKNQAKIISYTGDEEVVSIPGIISGHPIISIEKGCFKENENIREVYMSDHIGAINGDAFKGCINLEKIHISESVTSMTGSVFSGCTALTEVNIPDSMQEAQRGIFKDSPLTTIYIGKGVKKISPDAFYKGDADFVTGIYLKKKTIENIIIDSGNENFSVVGTSLLSKNGKVLYMEMGDPTKVVIPEGVEEIGPSAYEKISSLSEVIFPSTLKVIHEKAFAGTYVASIELPGSLQSVKAQAFSFCRELRNVDLNDGIEEIGQQAFEGCPIQKVYIPASVISLGTDSFFAISTYQGQTEQKFKVDSANRFYIADGVALYQKSNEAMTLIKAYNYGLRLKPNETSAETIDYSVQSGTTIIAPQAFARCNNLNSIVLPEGLLSIGDMAFWDCSQLKDIHIPDSCKDISPKAFMGININKI